MPVTVVVGGQYGSEGKGKVAAYLAQKENAAAVVRCGGSNSGHTVYNEKREKFVFRQLPTAAITPGIKCILVSGSYIDVEVLTSEILSCDLQADRLLIDPFAVIITADHKYQEDHSSLKASIGSTASGTGAAVLHRVSRSNDILFAKDHPKLKEYIFDTKSYIAQLLENNQRVIVEGTQGHGLSLLHSKEYPYVTSRDTSASGFISEAGISPLYVDDIVLVIRSFPIRVAGNSGKLENEICWNELVGESDLPEKFVEYTTVTKKIRRVARFDPGIVIQAISVNKPTRIVLNHLDYIRDDLRNNFVQMIEEEIKQRVDFIGIDIYSIEPYSQGKRIMLQVI